MAKAEPLPTLPARYTLWPSPEDALLGTGGASAVWRVQDEALGLLVALKVLKSEGRRFHARLEREAVLSSRVVHPNVIGLHDVGRTPDGKSYLAFALASDGSMLDLAASPPPWSELRQLMIQLLQALAALHARGILHLDVKLSNLLLHRVGAGPRQVWLADLGVARAFTGEDDDDKSVVGTVSYMAPERLTGQHHLWCPATDLFAVGAVFFRLLSGRLPYPARDPAEGMQQRMRPPTTVPIRAGLRVPARVADVVLPMLQYDHRGRFDLAADVIRALERLPDSVEPAGVASPDLPAPAPGADNPAGRPATTPARGVPVWFRPAARVAPEVLERPPPQRRVPQAPGLLPHREIRLVGREREFELMWRAARTALRNRRPVLLEITGPRGVGRSRLVDEFLRTLEEQGLGEGVPMEYAVADGPQMGLRGAWRRVMPPGSKRDHYIQEIGSALARDRGVRLSDCLPDAQALARWIDPSRGDAPTLNRSALRGMLVEHLERRAWRGLSWLRVEDAHLAGENEDVWPIIDQLMARSAPLLVIVSTRSDHLSASLLELRALHHKAVRTITLEPLPPQASTELVAAHLPLVPALSQQVARHGRGIPRHIHELMTWWIGSGQLVEQDEATDGGRAWALADAAAGLPADQRAFARARYRGVAGHAATLAAMRALALSGPGTPLRVLDRIVGEGTDRLVLDRLVDLEHGQPVFNPPELQAVVLAHLPAGDPARVALHRSLAEAWVTEGDSPDVHARVGRHRLEAGDPARALSPLDRALRGLHQTRPVPKVCALAGRVIGAAEATEARGGEAWVHAALVLADARWRGGDDDGAQHVDTAIASQRLSPSDTLRAACARVRRVGPTRAEALQDLDRLRPMLPQAAAPDRADFGVTLAMARAWRLDLEGALAELHDALASRPDPETACRGRLLRARLLQVIDPVVAWHAVLRTIDVARDHGLLRFEVLAWGLAGEPMVTLGRGGEAIERLRTGVARLEAHGEVRAAAEAQLHLAAALRAAGRNADARAVLTATLDAPPPAFGTHPTDARAALGVLAALEHQPEQVTELLPQKPGWVGPAVGWALLAPLARLLQGDAVAVPRSEAVRHALSLGADGLFLVRAAADLLVLKGEEESAQQVEALLARSCRRLGVDRQAGDDLLQRFHRARR